MVNTDNIQPAELSTGQPGNYHIPVLLKETIEALQVRADGTYVDCTLGGGGHSRAILEKLSEQGKLFVFDQDEAAGMNVPADKRVTYVPQNFRYLQRFLRLHGIKEVDGILADLGVSSYQFDEAARGFSTRFDAALDMRMDQRQRITAANIIMDFSASQFHKMFEQYGEVTNSKTLAHTLVQKRAIAPIRTVQEFKQALHHVVKGNPQKYFAQVFQALRIQVNDELVALEELLQQIPDLLKPGGRIAIITFHSLEDRIVKCFFRNGTFADTEIDEVYGLRYENPLKVITKKPVSPSADEIKQNNRSRSARLRVAEKKIMN
jgi:16S rRNA (cytosine1402-N4)-methyltransferase